MADRVTEYASKSLAYFLGNVTGIDAGYVITSDFDWDEKPDPASLGRRKIDRPTPYAGVILVADQNVPFTVGNILRELNIEYQLWVAGGSYTEVVQATADVKQALAAATNPVSSNVGIQLFDFSVASGVFHPNAGTLQVEIDTTQHFGPADQSEENNMKFRSVTPITLTAFKDTLSTLLENGGRINLTDS